MGFEGYSTELQGFFAALRDNNNRDWFSANKAVFDALVIEPSVQLVADLSGPLGGLNPVLHADPKINKSIRRVFRDTRFSKDKTPYHTYLHLVFWAGTHPNASPGLHLILGADGFGFGAGHWEFGPQQLETYRAAIRADAGQGIAKAVDAVCVDGVELDPPALARVPNGFDKAERWSGWARYKGLVVKSQQGAYPAEMFSADGVEYVAKLAHKVAPLNRYLMDNVFVD